MRFSDTVYSAEKSIHRGSPGRVRDLKPLKEVLTSLNMRLGDIIQSYYDQIAKKGNKLQEEILDEIEGIPEVRDLKERRQKIKQRIEEIRFYVSVLNTVPNLLEVLKVSEEKFILFQDGMPLGIKIGNTLYESIVGYERYESHNDLLDIVYEVESGKFLVLHGNRIIRVGNQYLFDDFKQENSLEKTRIVDSLITVRLGDTVYDFELGNSITLRKINGVPVKEASFNNFESELGRGGFSDVKIAPLTYIGALEKV